MCVTFNITTKFTWFLWQCGVCAVGTNVNTLVHALVQQEHLNILFSKKYNALFGRRWFTEYLHEIRCGPTEMIQETF